MKAIHLTPFVALAAASCPSNQSEYDYVVVGSGPGGGPLAANLAREGYSVFLIEAGGDTGDSLVQSIPAWANAGVETPGMGWGFFVSHYLNQTQEQRDRYYSYRLDNGSLYTGLDPPTGAEPLGIYYPRGATVGGSMVANAMNFMMPPDSNWDYIANLTGDETWAAEEMRQYFVELERNVYTEGDPSHGYDGFITSNQNNITYVTSRPGVMRVVRNALAELEGVHNATEEQVVQLMQRDVNSADPARFEHEGVYQTIVNIDENRRRSSPYNYIAETLAARDEDGRPLYPLTLSTRSLATRVLFDTTGDTPRAVGVEYQVGSNLYEAEHAYDPDADAAVKTVKAKREVIVAGGAFNTPQILKLSGVGPREELEEHGIPVVVDLPSVGEYLRDNYEAGIHINAATPWENNPNAGCLFNPNATAEEDRCLAEWLEGYGPYGQGSAPIFMLMRTSEAETADSDLIIFGGASFVFDGHYPGYSRARYPQESFFFAIVDAQSARQEGYVRLRSSNPRHQPEIHLDYYPEGSDSDIRALSEGVERLLGILGRTGEPYEPFEVVQPAPGEPLEQNIRDHSWSHHVTSSCRMGPAGNGDYCVDSKFKVNGVEGLRVVDGSVFPISPGGFPGSSTATISQKAFYDIIAAAKEIEPSIRLRRAIRVGDALLVQRILKSHPKLLHNPDPSAEGLSNSNLHLAASLGHDDICRVLLRAGHEEPCPALNELHQTALMLAARAGQRTVAEVLCEYDRTCLMRQDARGRDAIMEAAAGGHDAVLQMLLANVPCGAFEAVRRADLEGNTALHFASSNGNLKVLRTLMAAGADVERRNHWNWLPASYSATVQAEVYFKGLVSDVGRKPQLRKESSATPLGAAQTTAVIGAPAVDPSKMTGGVRVVADNSDDD